jgi:spermidine synthase
MKIPWYTYFLSYFYLTTIKKLKSAYNPGLCIQMEAGKLLLNTTNANYSYGNLHKVFEEVFELMDLSEKPPQNVLILGLGTGSVIDIMQRQYGLDPNIVAIEIDQEIVNVLEYWDKLDLNKTELRVGDAFILVNTLNHKFDLIIVDLFIDLNVHPKIHDIAFVEQLSQLLQNEGRILINYVVNTKEQSQKFADYQLLLMRYFKEIVGHEVMGMNRVLALKVPY